MHSNICTHTDARTHVLRKRDIRECLSGNFVRLFPLFSALTQVESQASWTRAKFYNFPLKVLSPPFPAPSTPPALVQHSCRPAKQLTHISVSAYATKWPKVAWWLVTIFFCLFPAALTLNFSPCCRAGSGFYCFQCLFLLLDCRQHLRGENKHNGRREFFGQRKGLEQPTQQTTPGGLKITFSSPAAAAQFLQPAERKPFAVKQCELLAARRAPEIWNSYLDFQI